MPTKVSELTNDSGYITNAALTDLATKEEVSAKQDTLVSGTNIKTINGNSILGAGNISIGGGGGGSLPTFRMSLSGTTITMTEGTISNFFDAINAGKGNYRAYIKKGNLLFSNTSQALTEDRKYFVRFDAVAPIKNWKERDSYYASKESLVIKVTNNSLTLVTGDNWMFDSNIVIIDIDNNNYFYGSKSDINYGTQIYLCTTNNLGLEGYTRISTNLNGVGYDYIELEASLYGSVYRYYLYNNNKIKRELINGSYTLYCDTYNITGASGQVGITEDQYETLRSNLYSNQGNIKISGSEYGDGILIKKS